MDSKDQNGNLVDKAHLLKPYQKVRHQFDSEYDRSNPITAEQATKSYFKWMIGKDFKVSEFSFFLLANGYTLSNEAYENVQVDFDIDKGALDQLINIGVILKKNQATEASQDSTRSRRILGISGKSEGLDIFESFQPYIVESPLDKFRRIVKTKVLKRKPSPILQLVSIINKLFGKSQNNKTTGKRRHVHKRKSRKRLGIGLYQ